MPGGFFGRGPSRFPFAQRRPEMAALLTSVKNNNVLLDGPSLLLQAVIIPGDKTTEGQLVEAVALPWFEIIELISLAAHPNRSTRLIGENGRRSSQLLTSSRVS